MPQIKLYFISLGSVLLSKKYLLKTCAVGHLDDYLVLTGHFGSHLKCDSQTKLSPVSSTLKT